MKKYIPNILTTFRIFLVPVFIWLIFYYHGNDKITLATIVFIVASITDYFDGMLARKFNVISDFGKLMDPLADKLLVISAILAMTFHLQIISVYVTIVIIIREVVISYFREYYARKKVIIPANIWGKIKTFVQMIAIGVVFFYSTLAENVDSIKPIQGAYIFGLEVIFWLIAILTWYSGIGYYKAMILERKNK